MKKSEPVITIEQCRVGRRDSDCHALCRCVGDVCWDLWCSCLSCLSREDLELTYSAFAEKYTGTGQNERFLEYIRQAWKKKKA